MRVTEVWLKFILLGYFCLFSLTGCINYAGIKSHSKPYDASSLNDTHSYSANSSNKKTEVSSQQNDWWNRFRDAELDQLISIALADSPDIQIAKNRVEQAQYIAKEAGASLWPTLNFDGNVSRERLTNTTIYPPPFGGETVYQGNVFLNFQYEFDFWGKNRQNIASLVSKTQAAKANLAQAQLMISTSVASAYFQLQSNIVQCDIAENNLRKMQAILKITQTLNQRHIESALPLTTVISNVQAAVMNIEQAKQAVKISTHQLTALMGKNPLTTNISVKPLVFKKQILILPANLPANLLSNRPDIVASRFEVESAAHKVNVSKARFFPNINLLAFYSYQSIGLNKLFQAESRDYAIQPAIDLPIFDASARRANLRARYAEYDLAVNQYNQTIITALHQVADQLSTLQSVKAQLNAQNYSFNASSHNLSLTRLRYEHGIDDDMTVLNSEVNFLSQKRAQVQLQTQSILALIGTINALGGNDGS